MYWSVLNFKVLLTYLPYYLIKSQNSGKCTYLPALKYQTSSMDVPEPSISYLFTSNYIEKWIIYRFWIDLRLWCIRGTKLPWENIPISSLFLTKDDHFKVSAVDKQLGTVRDYLLAGQFTAHPCGRAICLAPMTPAGTIYILTKLDERAHFPTIIHDINLHNTHWSNLLIFVQKLLGYFSF